MPDIYESPRLLAEYLLFHYGTAEEIMPWDFGPRESLHFPVRTVTALTNGMTRDRALDAGCAAGRSTFELSRFCRRVTGIDYSRQFIAAAEQLRTTGFYEYSTREEAAHSRSLRAELPPGCKPERVCFERGDAMHLRPDLGGFDLVHAANLLCRLAEPVLFIERLPSLVLPGGTLILTTPCTWLEEFTPPANWPTGTTFDWLAMMLEPHFILTGKTDLPFLIREHARKFQWSVALATTWTRRA